VMVYYTPLVCAWFVVQYAGTIYWMCKHAPAIALTAQPSAIQAQPLHPPVRAR
jgi:hypothetical protein